MQLQWVPKFQQWPELLGPSAVATQIRIQQLCLHPLLNRRLGFYSYLSILGSLAALLHKNEGSAVYRLQNIPLSSEQQRRVGADSESPNLMDLLDLFPTEFGSEEWFVK